MSDRTVEIPADEHEATVDVEVWIVDELNQEVRFEMRVTEEELVGLQRAADRAQAIAYAELTRVLPTLSIERVGMRHERREETP